MQELAQSFSFHSYEGGAVANGTELKNIVVVFDGSINTADSCDIIHKFRNSDGKWAFNWTKKEKGNRTEFRSEYKYDDILSIKNNRLVFVKGGQTGFWYFNTRTEFFFP